MGDTIEFVDKIDEGAGTVLDLNAAPWKVLKKGFDLSPPPLRRSIARTMLDDGSLIPASAYDNRILKMTLLLVESSEANLATEMTKLHRELDKPRNIIKFQRDGAAAPVFFRTFRSPDYRLRQEMPTRPEAELDVRIVAEPFAYGLRVQAATNQAVQNDPEDANGLFFDVGSIVGDVPSPAVIVLDGDSDFSVFYLATRRRGTPSNLVHFTQCEDMTLGTDTTDPGGGPDAAMSGAGTNNFARCTFAAATIMTTRLTHPMPTGADGVDKRGIYRVFLRYRKEISGDTINMRMRLGGATGQATDTVTLEGTANPSLADLGLIQIPPQDPVQVGYNSEDAGVAEMSIAFQAERVSGSGDLDFDYVLLIPADEEFSISDFLNTIDTTIDEQIFDGPNDMVYIATEAVVTVAAALTATPRPPARVGSLPMLSSNQTNRIYVIHTRSNNGRDMRVTDDHVADVYYWPRFLFIR